MTSIRKGEVAVNIEAGDYTLAFDLGACVAIERACGGKPLKQVLSQLEGDDPNVTILLTVIWAGLAKHHGLSEEDVGHLVTMPELEIWGKAIGEAFGGSEAAKTTARPRKAKA